MSKTKTIRIKVSLGIGISNCRHKDELEVEVDENATPEEIKKRCDAETSDWASNYIDFGFTIIED